MLDVNRTILIDANRTRFDAASWLGLVAAPAFATMAVLTDVLGNGAGMMGSMGAVASALSGMTPMYVLMAIFHSGPWLKLIAAMSSKRAIR